MPGSFIAGSAATQRMIAMTKYASARLMMAAGIAALILAAAIAPARAQDVAPDTPAELRDFKLNPEKAPPVQQPLPTTEPVSKPVPTTQPAVVTVPAVRAVQERVTAPRPPAARPQPAKASAVPSRPSAPPIIAKPAAERQRDVISVAPAETDDRAPVQSPAPEIAPPSAAPATPSNSTFPWQYILVALLVAAGLAIAWLLKRRRAIARVQPAITQPIEEAAHDHHIANSDPPAKLAAVPAASNRPKLEVSFIPERASISLKNLTINGRLHIANNGESDAAELRLNAAVISASKGQEEAISSYFASPWTHGKDLGSAKVGEQIALEMDLMIPIADLQTFAMGAQQLLVPIILARVAYQWDEGDQNGEAQLSWLIGREASPPKPKMGALRLDLGPRSFGSLGQRPLFA